jgi:hypothetical protein
MLLTFVPRETLSMKRSQFIVQETANFWRIIIDRKLAVLG